MLLKRGDVSPALLQEKSSQPAFMPSFATMRTFPNSVITRNYYPSGFTAECSYPIFIFCIGFEFVLEVHKRMLWLDHLVQCPSVPNS